MIEIVGNHIKMTRGDTLKLKLELQREIGENRAGRNLFEDYTPATNDVIKFTMKRTYSGEALITKIIPHNTMLLELTPNDTKNLQQQMVYKYDIQITFANGDVDTFIADANLTLLAEVGD